MKDRRQVMAAICVVAASSVSWADWRGDVALELRGFPQDALDRQQHGSNLSVSGEVEYHSEWDGGRQSLTIKPFARLDQHDSSRTHGDLREATWIYSDDGFEFRAGMDKVFWGVTEVYHLVDIINQTDMLENPDGERKLGQPMLKASWEQGLGVFDVFLMPHFRERRYPAAEGRPRTQPRVADELTQYENRRKEHHPDIALRWSQVLGDWDVGVGYFYGTGRDPVLLPGLDDAGKMVLIPRYVVISQVSIDLQGVVGDWLWKLEALQRSGQGESFSAMTGGFEYTFYGLADGVSDLGVLAEVMWDERGALATTPFNRDAFIGLRWAANDVAGTELLTGVVADWSNGSRFFNLEASRRFGNNWKASLQARLWSQVDRADPLYGVRDDDYVELELRRYF